LEAFIDEAPPEQGPRRFGNPAFRKWHALLEERVDGLLKEHIPAEVFEAWGGEELVIGEVRPYFVGGFGSKERLDYGTGHELSFFAFLGCLWKLGAFGDGSDKGDGEVERSLVLGVFEP
jgi:serine/threonine-protein phosphatase 2A activator